MARAGLASAPFVWGQWTIAALSVVIGDRGWADRTVVAGAPIVNIPGGEGVGGAGGHEGTGFPFGKAGEVGAVAAVLLRQQVVFVARLDCLLFGRGEALADFWLDTRRAQMS